MMMGTTTIDNNTAGPGESGRADRILEAGFKQPAGESVLIQSDSATPADARFEAAIQDVLSGLRKTPTCGPSARRSPRPSPARSRTTSTPR